jgi:hypothetical protein
MMVGLKEFLAKNDLRIGKDFNVKPPWYYYSLHQACYHYFQTFRAIKDSYHYASVFKEWTVENIGLHFTKSAADHIISTILNFHRFFELFLKDLLRRINPFLAVKLGEKKEELFKHLNNEIEADKIKTIEYSETIERVKYAFEYYSTSEVFDTYLRPYNFLIEKSFLEALEALAEWRNRIMHNGSALPNMFALDYLISQKIILLVDLIVEAEKNLIGEVPYYFKTATGIEVIKGFINTKFHYNEFNIERKSKALSYNLLRIGHLKEMGRASFNANPWLRINKSYHDPYDEKPISRKERFATSEKLHPHFYRLCNCICCGANTLVVYRKEFDNTFEQKMDFISWFRCYNCDYSLKNNMGEPSLFGLTNVNLFTE